MKQSALLACLLVTLTIAPAGAEDVNAIVESCADCHGENGVSQWTDVPTIAGVDAFVGSEALYIYRDSERPCASSAYRQGDTDRPEATMCKLVSNFSDDTIDTIAEHFAGLPFVAAKQDFDEQLAAAGKRIHDNKCSRCHSDGGSNPDDEAGILAGQWTGYLRTTFAEYASGEREQLGKMKKVMDSLSDDDTEALINYYASQQ